MIFYIIGGIVGIFFSVYLFIKNLIKYKKIDSFDDFVVANVMLLGRKDFKKIYAITYIHKDEEDADNTIKIVETPVRKKEDEGTEKTFYFEKANPQNHFHPLLGMLKIDSRFFAGLLLGVMGIGLILKALGVY